MDGGDYASIVAAIVAAFSAWAVSRSSAKGNKLAKELETKALIDAKELETTTARESVRSQAETDAYERARAFDTETITRQERKIDSLEEALGERESELGQVRTDNGLLHADIRMVSQENRDLQAELTSAHRVIESLRSYIHHNPSLSGTKIPEILDEAPPPSKKPAVDPEIRKVIDEAVEDGYAEPGGSYPDLD